MPRTTTKEGTQEGVTLDPALESKTVATTGSAPKSLGLARSEYDEDDLGSGFEGTTQDDFKIPFIAILQKGSPQCEEGNPRAIAGARPGMLINTATNQLYDGKEGIRIVPALRARKYIEWIPRDQGGGFVAPYDPESAEVGTALKAAGGRKFGKLKINDDNDLVETFELYSLLLTGPGSFERVMIAFASTQIGAYQGLMTTARNIQLEAEDGRIVTPPLYAHVYRLRTEFTTKKNYTWYKWVAKLDAEKAEDCRLPKTHPLFLEAKAFQKLVTSGRATAAYDAAVQEHAGGEDVSEKFEM